MKAFLFPLLLAASLGFASIVPAIAQSTTPRPNSYIGLRYRDVPKPLTDLGGWVIGLQQQGDYRHSIAYIRNGRREMIWFNRFVGRDRATGKAFFQVVDSTSFPALTKSQALIGYGFCKRNGKSEPNLVAIAQPSETEFWTKIDRAWRANQSKEKLESISTKGIVCENPGWGV